MDTIEGHNGNLKSRLIDTFPHGRTASARRSRRFKSPLPHTHPVWQRFTPEVDSTRKLGRTSSEVLTAECCRNETQYFLALWYDTATQNSCLESSALRHVETLSTCGGGTSLTCSWPWRDDSPVKTTGSFRVIVRLFVCSGERQISGNNKVENMQRWDMMGLTYRLSVMFSLSTASSYLQDLHLVLMRTKQVLHGSFFRHMFVTMKKERPWTQVKSEHIVQATLLCAHWQTQLIRLCGCSHSLPSRIRVWVELIHWKICYRLYNTPYTHTHTNTHTTQTNTQRFLQLSLLGLCIFAYIPKLSEQTHTH